MTDGELRDLLGQLAAESAAIQAALRETDRRLRESGEETDRRLRESGEETDRRLRELGKQIGGLGDKFGSFTEGMALPSMQKILEDRFGATHVMPRARVRRNGRSLEVDVLAYSNTDRNEAIVVEVKSHLREEGLEQILRILRDFPEFYPEHREKKLYGILAAVSVPDNLREKVLRSGIYLARISGEAFSLDVPDGFVPQSFQEPRTEA